MGLKEALKTVDLSIDRTIYAHILQECCDARALSEAKQVHAHIVENGLTLNRDVFLGNRLIRVYDKCASPDDARWVFDRMPHKNVVSWNMMIAAYSQHGQFNKALQLFEQMNKQGVEPTIVTFINTLKACTSLSEGKCVYAFIKDNGFESDLVVGNALVSMFGKCGSLEMSVKIFLKMPQRDFITWTTMIAAHVQHGKASEAIQFFKEMDSEGVNPTIMTYATILSACCSPTTLDEGKSIHAHVIRVGYESHEIIGAALLTMYGKCGMVDDARWLFDDTSKHDVVTWNSMISVYVRHGCSKKALQLFQQMHFQCVKPNGVTFVSTLDACTDLSAFEEGKFIHNCILDVGVESDAAWNALLNMYGNCGSQSNAVWVFDRMRKKDVVSWTSMIQVFAQNGHFDKALQAFQSMQEEGVKPNKVTFVNILKACIDCGELIKGKLMHTLIIDKQLELDIVIGNALITMYGNCGSLVDACKVFMSMPTLDAVSWTAVIAVFAQNGYGKEALEFFPQMLQLGVTPTNITYISILEALASLTALEEGKMIYFLIVDSGMESNVVVGNAFINFYAKCGKVDEAFHLFQRLPNKDIVSWSAMIAAYAHQGKGKEAFNLFLKMKERGLKPDDVTFVSLLSACSHAGLIVEGFKFFYLMAEGYKFSPSEEHYRCMIDLLSRAGWVDEAEAFINNLPSSPTIVAWMTLLGGCQVHGNMEKAKCVAEHVLELDSQNPAGYVILSNIYAAAGKEVEADKIRKLMKDKGVNEAVDEISMDDDDRVHDLAVRG